MSGGGASPPAHPPRSACANFGVVEEDTRAHAALPTVTPYVGGARGVADTPLAPGSRGRRVSLRGACVRARAAAAGALAAAFLPRGYPRDYIQYQQYDTLQALCSYLRGILATHATLVVAGVGDANASAIAATLAWVVRDGAAMVSSLIFATWGSSRFDRNCKSWRLFADVINDVALSLEMSAAVFGRDRAVAVMCVAACCKALCGTASGACRAVITTHFAVCNNAADVASKESSQELMVSLVGMVAGLALAGYVEAGSSAPVIVFVLLTCVHVVANWMAVRGLQLRTLNTNRAEAVIEAFLEEGERVLGPAEAAGVESLWPSSGWWGPRACLGALLHPSAWYHTPALAMGCRLTALPDDAVTAAAAERPPARFVVAVEHGRARALVRVAISAAASPGDEFAAAFMVRVRTPLRARVCYLAGCSGWGITSPCRLSASAGSCWVRISMNS